MDLMMQRLQELPESVIVAVTVTLTTLFSVWLLFHRYALCLVHRTAKCKKSRSFFGSAILLKVLILRFSI